MTREAILATHDAGLLRHWQTSGLMILARHEQFTTLQGESRSGPVIWVDTALPGLPRWQEPFWRPWLQEQRVIAASSSPSQAEGMAALDAGCMGYCHAFGDAESLLQVQAVVVSGGLWVGRELLQRLLGALQVRLPAVVDDWSQKLTPRECEVARLAAKGLHNAAIARQCDITERTVKAHLAAVFAKLGVADRLQLALRIHGLA